VGRELPRSRSRGIGVLPFPGVGPGDGNGTRVGHCGRTSSAKELDSRVEFAVGPELGGRKGEVDVVGVAEVDLVVVPTVAVVGEHIAAAGSGRLERASADDPIAEVDEVDVLLDQDVAREGTIPEPVAKAVLIRRDAGMRDLNGCGGVVVAGYGGEF